MEEIEEKPIPLSSVPARSMGVMTPHDSQNRDPEPEPSFDDPAADFDPPPFRGGEDPPT